MTLNSEEIEEVGEFKYLGLSILMECEMSMEEKLLRKGPKFLGWLILMVNINVYYQIILEGTATLLMLCWT